MRDLQTILLDVIKESELAPKLYATQHSIHLGMNSCLRAIKNCRTSCVLLSQNIKPGHLITLIVKNVQAKSPNVPTFVQPNLEDFTREVFNVSAVAMSLPLRARTLICKPLHNWINTNHKKYFPDIENEQETPKIANEIVNKTNSGAVKRKHPTDINIEPVPKQVCRKEDKKQELTKDVIKTDLQEESVNKALEADFISFEDAKKDQHQNFSSKNENLSESKQQLSEAFAEIMQKVEKSRANSNNTSYRPTVVFKVCPNPARAEKAIANEAKRKQKLSKGTKFKAWNYADLEDDD